MKIYCPKARKLSSDLAGRWHEILAQSPHLAGPYFRPEFTLAVATVRDDVEVAVLEDGGQIVGFFPFQRRGRGIAQPVAGILSNYQGVIAASDVRWQPDQIMASCRLAAWEFTHQLASQEQLAPHFAEVATSPVIDVSCGFEAWLEGRKAAGAAVKELLQESRKLERESKGVVFQWHSPDWANFEQLRAWKSAEYAHTGVPDVMAKVWVVRLLDKLRTTAAPHLSGVLSTLHVSGKLWGVHFGMQSGNTLHSWFSAYDPQQSRSSRGQVLLLKIAEQALAHGVSRIDLGKGDQDYKLTLASDSVKVAVGAIDRRPLGRVIRKGLTAARDLVKQSPLGAPATKSVRWLQRMSQWLAGDGAARHKL